MINQEEIKEKLIAWLKDFVEKPNPALNGWPPCPYARQARINNKIEIVFSDPADLQSTVEENLGALADKDVLVVCFDHTQVEPDALALDVISWNQDLMSRNYVILEDHPGAPEVLNGLTMNFGFCGLLVVSELNKLNSAADQIRAKGYYDTWPQENIDNVVTWRYK